jgi:hypothetical protein
LQQHYSTWQLIGNWLGIIFIKVQGRFYSHSDSKPKSNPNPRILLLKADNNRK